MISCHFKGFWKNKNKKLKFSMTTDLQKNVILDSSCVCRFRCQISELLHLRCSDVILWWFPAILRAFEKLKKIEVFDGRGPAQILCLDVSNFFRFCSQMSESLQFRRPDVLLWWFPAILRAFEKIKKIQVFNDRGPAEKCRLWTFRTFALQPNEWIITF